MPPSQLKRLKASLREQGITGQQKSKKQKKQQNGANADQRVQRQAALQGIRDAFNPFEIKGPSRPAKFQTLSNVKPANGLVGRPGVTKSMGEEARRKSLLPEMQRRNKVGGVLDRRIGENDPSMDPEEKALQRFQRQQQRKKGTMFDLEEADEEGALTHLGKAIDFGGEEVKDDFDAGSLSGSEDGDNFLKRRRPSAGEEGDEAGTPDGENADEPDRKRSRKEIMEEVMAKSKYHKYERQKAKEEDDDLRAELDAGLGDMLALLSGHKPAPKPVVPAGPTQIGETSMNADRLAMMQGKTKAQMDKQYDARMREMAMDKRAAPADRTKTAEEMAANEAKRLKELEESRQRRMRGEEVEESEEETRKPEKKSGVHVRPEEEDIRDDAAEFGFVAPEAREKVQVLDDEDEFELDDDLIASGSDVEASSASGEEENSDEGSDSDSDSNSDEEDVGEKRVEEEEDEFVRGILYKDDKGAETKNAPLKITPNLAYTYACPRSHAELLEVVKGTPVTELPTIVQRIRALYHTSLAAENKEKMQDFSTALIDHISYMALNKQPLAVIEQLIRHIHSLSRTYAETIANAFRGHLKAFHERGQPTSGDLIILTAIGSIYPTSDHFHQVVTPAILLMARWLGMTTPTTSSHLSTGAFLVTLCLHYQRLSKRYIPEALRFTIKSLQARPTPSPAALQPHILNLLTMAELWHATPAFTEIFSPLAHSTLQKLKTTTPLKHLDILLAQARLRRRPQELHHHRPVAIRQSYPKFEEGFDPNKHYDPDKDRADAAKLRAEYKKERKGAMRELRKDANFMAREQLREKKEADAAYEKKYKRLVAEIQGEEGHEAKEYEREKRMRKGRGKK